MRLLSETHRNHHNIFICAGFLPLIFLLNSLVLGCSVGRASPLSFGAGYAESIPMFLGEVVIHTVPFEDKELFTGRASGVRLKIIDAINHPAPGKKEIDLYYFRHDSGCRLVGQELRYPTGTRLLVIGRDRNKRVSKYVDEGMFVMSSLADNRTTVVPSDYRLPAPIDFDYMANREELAGLANGEYKKRIELRWNEIMAMATDAKELTGLRKNSVRRKKILTRISKIAWIDFPSFVDRRLTNSPITAPGCLRKFGEPLKPACDPKTWTNAWEKALISDWFRLEGRRQRWDR